MKQMVSGLFGATWMVGIWCLPPTVLAGTPAKVDPHMLKAEAPWSWQHLPVEVRNSPSGEEFPAFLVQMQELALGDSRFVGDPMFFAVVPMNDMRFRFVGFDGQGNRVPFRMRSSCSSGSSSVTLQMAADPSTLRYVGVERLSAEAIADMAGESAKRMAATGLTYSRDPAALALKMDDGKSVQLSDFAGKVVFVQHWASW